VKAVHMDDDEIDALWAEAKRKAGG